MFIITVSRKRIDKLLYRVCSIHLFGFILIYRGYELLTVSNELALPDEKRS